MEKKFYEHHQQTIDNLIAEYKDDPRFPALIIGGSVAKGVARADSDVDFIILATDDEFEKRKVENDFFINRTDLTDYQGGYVDGKIIDFNYLLAVHKHGNDPSRAAFDGAFVAYSRILNLDKLVSRIPVFPYAKQSERIHDFYCMTFMQNWLMGEADRHENVYTKTRAASQLALYSGRLILAYNQILFPYHKWFLEYIDRCTLKPDNFLQQIHHLLHEPSLKNANDLFRNLQEFNEWGISDLEAYTWFMKEVEWSWMSDATPLEDL